MQKPSLVSSRLVRGVVALIASATAVGYGCAERERTGVVHSAVWGGSNDVSGLGPVAQARLDVVVKTPGCSGTLISPRVVLTAEHCVAVNDGGTNAATFTIFVGSDKTAYKTKRAVSSGVPYVPNPVQIEPARDVTLLFLKEPVLEEAIIVRPAIPYDPPYNGVGMSGYSSLNADKTNNDDGGPNPDYMRFRQAKWFSSLVPGTDLQSTAVGSEYVWRLNFNQGAGTQHGDSGGLLFSTLVSSNPDLNGARVPIGVVSGGGGGTGPDEDINPTWGSFTDITRGPVAAWLNTNMLDSAHSSGHGASWHWQHQTNSSTYWFGEADYTGPCKNGGDTNLCYAGSNAGTDCDCDHWFDRGSVVHDNCPLVYNPEQTDTNDDTIGDKCQDDRDGDGKLDYEDNCVTVRNGAQTDTNFAAELEPALMANAVCATTGIPGHTPTPSDTPAYVACWHATFPGDACDADATTHTTNVPSTNGEQDFCLVLHPGSGAPSVSYEGSCPVTLNTGLQFDSNIADALGQAQSASGTSAPAFCWCPYATSSDWNTARDCQRPELPYKCAVADDLKFPDLNLAPDVTKPWRRITRYTNGQDVLYGSLATTHVQRKPYNQLFDNPQVTSVISTWDFRADLGTFFQPSSSLDMTGLLWTHVTAFTPSYGQHAPATNYANHYRPIKAERTNSIRVADDFAYVPLRFDHCPLDLFDEFGSPLIVGFVQLGGTTGGTLALGAGSDGLRNLTSNFTPQALQLAGGVYTGAYDLVSDSGYSVPAAGAGRPAILVDVWTTRIRGALTVGLGGVIDGVIADVPWQSWTPVRAYASSTGQLYSVEDGGTMGPSLVARDVSAALQGVPLQTASPLSESVGTLQALAFQPVERALFAIDTVAEPGCSPTGGCALRLRLLRIEPNGAVDVLWATRPSTSVPGQITLTSSPQGYLTLGLSAVGASGGSGGSYDVVVLDASGRPLYSTSDSTTSLKIAPVSNRRHVTIAPVQPFSNQHWDFGVQARTASQLTAGLCGASWLKAAADDGTRLGNPAVDCP